MSLKSIFYFILFLKSIARCKHCTCVIPRIFFSGSITFLQTIFTSLFNALSKPRAFSARTGTPFLPLQIGFILKNEASFAIYGLTRPFFTKLSNRSSIKYVLYFLIKS